MSLAPGSWLGGSLTRWGRDGRELLYHELPLTAVLDWRSMAIRKP